MPFSTSSVRDGAARAGDASTRVYRIASRQPSWVMRLAVGAALAVMLAIILLLVIPALLVFLLVLGAAAIAQATADRVRSLFSGRPATRRDDRAGRRNVRVIEPRDV
jgi:hypothetical protein